MTELTKTRVGQFRIVSLLEGVSYLLLLGIAVPLKYVAEEPILVRIIGPIHGVLFIAYVVALARCAQQSHFNLARSAAYFVASLIPFGAFVVEWQLRKEESPPGPP